MWEFAFLENSVHLLSPWLSLTLNLNLTLSLSLVVLRAVSQLIMRGHKPTVEYKLALQ